MFYFISYLFITDKEKTKVPTLLLSNLASCSKRMIKSKSLDNGTNNEPRHKITRANINKGTQYIYCNLIGYAFRFGSCIKMINH